MEQRSRTGTVAKRPQAKSATPELAAALEGPFVAAGTFLKLSSKGKWQKRIFQLRGTFLMYYASQAATKKGIPKGSDSSAMPDAAIDLHKIKTIEYDAAETSLVLTSFTDKTICLKFLDDHDAASHQMWIDRLEDSKEGYLTAHQAEVDETAAAMATLVEEDEDEDDDDDDEDEVEVEATVVKMAEMTFTAPEVLDAAAKLQAAMRAKAARTQVAGMKEKKAQDGAASKLQAAMRGNAARARVADLKSASAESASEVADAANRQSEAQAPTTFQGFVEKQGHSSLGFSFKKRLFVLAETGGEWMISYYQGTAALEANKKGTIALKGAQVAVIDGLNFSIQTSSGKSYPCRVETSDEAIEWIAKINSAIGHE